VGQCVAVSRKRSNGSSSIVSGSVKICEVEKADSEFDQVYMSLSLLYSAVTCVDR